MYNLKVLGPRRELRTSSRTDSEIYSKKGEDASRFEVGYEWGYFSLFLGGEE
jgi:hypothetical protein